MFLKFFNEKMAYLKDLAPPGEKTDQKGSNSNDNGA